VPRVGGPAFLDERSDDPVVRRDPRPNIDEDGPY
jgi:hypothetical protein